MNVKYLNPKSINFTYYSTCLTKDLSLEDHFLKFEQKLLIISQDIL